MEFIVRQEDYHKGNLCKGYQPRISTFVMDAHEEINHNGERHKLSQVRNQHWIQRSKSYINKVLHKCINYRKFNSRPYNYPKSLDLPSLRSNNDVSFSGIGVDYSGSLYRDVLISDSTNLFCVTQGYRGTNFAKI